MKLKHHLFILPLLTVVSVVQLLAQSPPPPPPPPPPMAWDMPMPTHGFLGIIMHQERNMMVTDGKETETNTDKGNGKGVYVNDIAPESAAAEAGLKAGDIITAINNQATPNAAVLSDIIRQTKAGDKISLAYLRNDAPNTTEATLKARPPMPPKHDEHGNMGRKHNNATCAAQSAGCCQPNQVHLGVMVEAFDATLAAEKGMKTTSGAYVLEVVEKSAAEQAGLKTGDVIKQIDGKPVYSHRDVIQILSKFKPNDKVKVNYERNGKKNATTATLQAQATKKHCSRQNRERHWGNNDGDMDEFEWQGQNDGLEKHRNMPKEGMGDMKHRIIIKNDGENGDEPKHIKKRIIIKKDGDEMQDVEQLLENMDIEISDMYSGDEVQEMIIKIMVLDLESDDQMIVKDVFTPTDQSNAKMLSDKTLRIDVSQYPNPTQGKFTVAFYAPETGTLNVRIADASGKLVFNETLDNFAGQYQKELDLSANTKGIYFLQIAQNGKTLTKKVMVE